MVKAGEFCHDYYEIPIDPEDYSRFKSRSKRVYETLVHAIATTSNL